MDKDLKEMLEMDLNDVFYFGAYEVIRVPGGWMYTIIQETGTGGYATSSCFVPEPVRNDCLSDIA